ncbi:holin family protein [Jannaschia rubra]|uniref:holin family protein n=1 Tax=Jannaschia rubra TaxID=282197 RepID=UPI002492A1CB|nr:holin family protein [Jannaschia rubra]
MGMIGGLVAGSGAVETLGRAALGLTQAMRPDATEGQRLDHEGRQAALEQLGDEFALDRRGLFDRCVDGLNRLPRPMLALGTMGLFVYAMAEPVGFAARMEGLGYVPDPLWWLLGAIVGFYFGARELHYVRRPPKVIARPAPVHSAWIAPDDGGADLDNPALRDWKGAQG